MAETQHGDVDSSNLNGERQPPEVQEAIEEHDKSGDWPISKTPLTRSTRKKPITSRRIGKS
jgi:hypothetical protein